MCGNVWGYAQIAVPDLCAKISNFGQLWSLECKSVNFRFGRLHGRSDWRAARSTRPPQVSASPAFAQRAACQWRPTGHAPRAVLVPNAWVQMCANLCEFGRIWAERAGVSERMRGPAQVQMGADV